MARECEDKRLVSIGFRTVQRAFWVTLLLVLAGALGVQAQTVALQDRLVAGGTLRYSIRAVHQLQLDYNRRMVPNQRAEDIQRKYELTGVLAIAVAAAGADGSAQLEARFEELRISQWFWGDDRAEAEQMVAAVLQERLSVTRDAAGNVNLTAAGRILSDRFRPDIQSLEALAMVPLLDVGAELVGPGSRWRRELPPERYRYGGEPAPGTAVKLYEYVGNRPVAERTGALLAVETSMPVAVRQLPAQAETALQLASQGMNLRASGESRLNRLELVEIEQGLVLAARDLGNLSYRVTVRNQIEDLRADIPVPLLTIRFSGDRELRWLGPGDAGLLAAVGTLPPLDELRSGRRAAARPGELSVAEIARELRAQREQMSPEAARRLPDRARAVEERELLHFPVNQPVTTPTAVVRFDRQNSRDGNGAVLVNAREPIVVPLYTVDKLEIENTQLVYQAWLRTEDVAGQAYLEMLCVFDGLGEFFSRGLPQALTGSHDWVRVETLFFLERGQKPSRVQLNLVVNGRGQVWIDDIRLVSRPLR